MGEFEKFILENADADVPRLLLSCHEWPSADDPLLGSIPPRDLAANTIEARRKLRRKAPLWYGCTGLVYPSSLCAEQCSSEAAALYKASVVRRNVPEGGLVADLTGGLGIDSHFFSKTVWGVLYNEIDEALVVAARHNFALLGDDNIIVRQGKVETGGIQRLLGTFSPDLIFLDPARRSSLGKKVFLMEDCSPDILSILVELFALCRKVLVKLSPMADISMVKKRLEAASGVIGNCISEIHVVSLGGECKELLVLLDRDCSGREPVLYCVEDGNILSFPSGDLSCAVAVFPHSPGRILFEPGASLRKAGAMDILCREYGLVKLARFTHLFFADDVSRDRVDELAGFGKFFKIMETAPLDKNSMKAFGRKYPDAGVSARNIPLSSDGLRSRLGVSSGEGVHIFGVTMDIGGKSGKFLLSGERIRAWE